MNVPQEFRYFAGCFIADSHEWFSTEGEWIAFAIHFSKLEQQMVIKGFIERLFANGLDDEALVGVWSSCAPSYFFGREAVRAFLTQVRDAIPVSANRKFAPQH